MTPEDKQRYISAVKEVAVDPAYKPRYDALIATYTSSFDTPAQSTNPSVSQFFVWNRYFLVQYEDLLREVDCKITIPYWDWTALPLNPYMSPVFNPETGFGDASRDTDNCVSNGPFNFADFYVTPSAGGGCLERNYRLQMHPTKAIIEQDLLTLPADEFDEFHRFLQLFIFSNIQCFIGGQMCSSAAANDPLHLLHMAQTDFIFSRWQGIDTLRLNARYMSDNQPLALASSVATVADYANNNNLPDGVKVCYGHQQFKSHVPASMTFLSDALLVITNNRDLKMECAKGGLMDQMVVGPNEKAFMKKMCTI